MSRSKVILVVMFVLALGAGVVMGVLATKQPVPNRGGREGRGPGGPGSSFEPMNLTEAQRDQMHKIWEEFVRSTDSGEKRQRLKEERDQQMEALLAPEQ